jgi:hypothetical protein
VTFKTPLDELSVCDYDKYVKASVAASLRQHIKFNAVMLADIQSNGLTGSAVAAIAKEYIVIRTLPKDTTPDKDQHYSKIAKLITRDTKGFENLTLSEKASVCKSIANQLSYQQRNGRRVSPASAVSKLIWFLHPAGWTMYDEFAANALVKKQSPTADRMVAFYQALESRGFTAALDKAQKCLDKISFPGLHASRIIDQVLWLIGCKYPKTTMRELQSWQQCALPASLSDELDEAGIQLLNEFPKNSLLRLH